MGLMVLESTPSWRRLRLCGGSLRQLLITGLSSGSKECSDRGGADKNPSPHTGDPVLLERPYLQKAPDKAFKTHDLWDMCVTGTRGLLPEDWRTYF